VFIIRFFTGSVFGMITGVFVGIIGLAVVLAGVVFLLAAVGGPGACTPGGGEIVVSAANADAFDQKWEGFNDILDGGSPSFLVLNESEITSRAERFIEEEAGEIGHVRVCIHDGFGEVTGNVDAFLGIDADFRAKGTVDLSGEHPVVDFDDIDIGNVPGFVVEPFEGLLEDAIEELLEKVDLDHSYTPTLTEGEVRIDGQP
jgi:hypothetical protein